MSGRTTTMRSSPPSQTAAAMMCSTSAITAASWFASSPECPCVPIGTSAAIARIATNSVGVHDRTAKASTVIAAPATAVMQPRAAALGLDEEPAELRAELGSERRRRG